MYIEIGADYLIKKDDIVGIFDLDNTTINNQTRDFLNKKEEEKKTVYIINDIPKSFILMRDGSVYIVELMPSVLKKRLELF